MAARRQTAESALARAQTDAADEAAALREAVDEATSRADELEKQLERREVEAGGAAARSVLRALERQVRARRGHHMNSTLHHRDHC